MRSRANFRRMICRGTLPGALLLGALLLTAHGAAAAAEPHERPGRPGGRVSDGRGQVLDNRYNHGHYYPATGASVRVLPEGYRP